MHHSATMKQYSKSWTAVTGKPPEKIPGAATTVMKAKRTTGFVVGTTDWLLQQLKKALKMEAASTTVLLQHRQMNGDVWMIA